VAVVRAREFTQLIDVHTALDRFRHAKINARDRVWRCVFWLVPLALLMSGLAALLEALEISL